MIFKLNRTTTVTSAIMLMICAAVSSCTTPVSASGKETLEFRINNAAPSRGVVVFENGARETFDSWDKVIANVDKGLRLFVYNRPGYGESQETNAPRDGRVIVETLRTTLQQQGLKPPYLLVGHSMGGLYMQLFARMYPQEVSGLVLVDSLLPGVIKRPEEFPFFTRVAKKLFVSRSVSREIDAIHETGEQILGLPWPEHMPMVRLVNVPKSRGAIGVDFGVVNKDPQTVAMVKKMYPNAHTVVCDSDHRIQEANPEIVVAAIREVMAKVRNDTLALP